MVVGVQKSIGISRSRITMATTEFWLNDQLVSTDAPQGLLVLDYLRRHEHLVGTKEGCKEGDCGACAILIGRLDGDGVRYEPVTSCLVPLGEMQGRHVVTIEGINLEGLSPVQQAVVDFGGTQCGYCTPGFIVSMTWYLMAEQGEPTLEGMQRAISGNLCRCTGYASINRASESLVDKFGESGPWADIWAADDRVSALVDAEMLPAYFTEMPERLRQIEAPELEHDGDITDFFVAGGTDIYVQQGERIPGASVKMLNHLPLMRGVRREKGEFRVGALTTFEEFRADEGIQGLIPRIDDFMFLIASLHIRNRATLGGNIVNASPIGDMTNMLLALGTRLVLSDGEAEREVAMKDFFLDYKVLDRRPAELITEIVFPEGTDATRINFEKLSKRKALDIATVCSGFRCEASADGVIEEVGISMGGVAPTPLYLEETCEFLVGRTIDCDTVREATKIAMGEASPISDVRGSADYKRLLVRQFLIAHFTECYPERVRFAELAS
ncbi:2Fe-2S iron-sulfur cluster binding domain-containing protein [Persicimonas caeni]|uniref:2Fe-2S iron-sulfur cluster binding domain-containing protein n=2 Tax=Persicimonas caeni TaxID=2292766 RepID=A0A4Y6PNU2_PERCE|nr:2Fe-2S iron-sulfur cluster binding domain-containing protein [Persicimonas caeni]QED31084.1 2Fe-2S iron-sulfur cluster binding domain-containing protein [Persicimonas caeni]